MINEADKDTIRAISKKYNVKRVLLFGSGLDPNGESRDIDLGVGGIANSDFFRFYGDLLLSLSRPVDVVDLSTGTKFAHMVLREGVPVYG